MSLSQTCLLTGFSGPGATFLSFSPKHPARQACDEAGSPQVFAVWSWRCPDWGQRNLAKQEGSRGKMTLGCLQDTHKECTCCPEEDTCAKYTSFLTWTSINVNRLPFHMTYSIFSPLFEKADFRGVNYRLQESPGNHCSDVIPDWTLDVLR